MAETNRSEPGLGARLAIGAIAGFVATMAMTATMRRLHGKLPRKERYPLPPRELTDRILAPPDRVAPDLALIAHFAYGAGCGALLAALGPKPGRLTGALAGSGVWLASYMGWVPAFGVLRPATDHPGRRNLLMLRAHFTWGWATAAGINELIRARATILAAGPVRDAPGRRSETKAVQSLS